MLHAGRCHHGPRRRAGRRAPRGVSAYQSTIGPKVPGGSRRCIDGPSSDSPSFTSSPAERGEELDGVTVDVDHRVVELLPDVG